MTTNPSNTVAEQQAAIRQEYKQQAATWGKAKINPHLQWVVDQLDLDPAHKVLDVAAGTGLFSRTVAPRVAHVTASDITPEMLEQGRLAAEADGITNVTFQQAPAEDLPFANASFDIVISRYAVHHFLKPVVVLKEMARVCKPDGTVVIVDMVSDENAELSARQNHFETIADTTHTRTLSPSELVRECTAAGLTMKKYLSREVPMDFDQWQAYLQKDAEPKRIIRAALEKDLAGTPTPTGFRPYISSEGKLTFIHTWGLIVCQHT